MKAFTIPAIVLPALLAAGSISGHAEVYQWQGDDGSTVYSDQKSSPGARSTTPAGNTLNSWSSDRASTDNDITALPQLEVVEEVYFSKAAPTESRSARQKPAPQLTEADCQALYGLSCDRVLNWESYALEACGDDQRCNDPDYLDRKYRPRLLSELLAVARRAGTRKNNAVDDINLFLKKKYTNFCAVQAQRYCLDKFRNRSGYDQCVDQATANCADSRELEDVLAEYRDLSPGEQRRIIEKARQLLSSTEGEDSLRYDQMLAQLIDLMMVTSALGL